MKHSLKIIAILSLLFVGALSAAAIQPIRLKIPQQNLSFSADGGSKSISVTSEGGTWEMLSAPASWAMAAKTATGVQVRVVKNTSPSPRYTSFTVGKGTVSRKVTISQAAARAASTQPGKEKVTGGDVETFTVNGVRFEMVRVEGGTFQMGPHNPFITYDDGSAHVEKIRTFFIGRTEVTQALWEAVMGSNPSKFKGANNPVEMVSWDDCQEFIDRLNRLTGRDFRLPTADEWEYAARGGKRSKGYKFSGSNDSDRVGWYWENSDRKTHPVGQKLDNELGLYDMTGNVSEWTTDKWSKKCIYESLDGSHVSHCVICGGNCFTEANYTQSVIRFGSSPSEGGSGLGLRLVLTL